jgi:hypothetical protein
MIQVPYFLPKELEFFQEELQVGLPEYIQFNEMSMTPLIIQTENVCYEHLCSITMLMNFW